MTTTTTAPEILIASAAPSAAPSPNGHGPKGPTVRTLSLGLIAVLPQVQVRRDGLSPETIAKFLQWKSLTPGTRNDEDNPDRHPYVHALAESQRNGREFDPVLVFAANGLSAEELDAIGNPPEDYILVGGFGRYWATVAQKKEFIRSEIRRGSWGDLLIAAGTHNLGNGQPLTPADLEEHARRLYLYTEMSQGQIARVVGMSAPTVSRWAKAWETPAHRLESTRNMGRPVKFHEASELVDEVRAKAARLWGDVMNQHGGLEQAAKGDPNYLRTLGNAISKRCTEDALMEAAGLVATALGKELDAIRAEAKRQREEGEARRVSGPVPLTVEEAEMVIKMVLSRNCALGTAKQLAYLDTAPWGVYTRAISDTRTVTDATLSQAINNVRRDLRSRKADLPATPMIQPKPAAPATNGHGPDTSAANFVAPVAPAEEGDPAGLLRTLRTLAAKLHDADEDTWIEAMGDTRLSDLRFALKDMIRELGEKIGQ